MDDPSAVAVVDSVAELIHEHLDFRVEHDMFVLGEEFFEVAVDHFEDKVEFLVLGLVVDVVEAEC